MILLRVLDRRDRPLGELDASDLSLWEMTRSGLIVNRTTLMVPVYRAGHPAAMELCFGADPTVSGPLDSADCLEPVVKGDFIAFAPGQLRLEHMGLRQHMVH